MSELESNEIEYNANDKKHRNIIKAITLIGLAVVIIAMYLAATSPYFRDVNGFTKDIQSMGIFAPLVFTMIACFQYIITIIPFGLINTVGGSLFGIYYGCMLNIIAMIIGSTIGFLLAKKYGQTFIKAFTSEEAYKEYVNKTKDNSTFSKLLAAAFILPFFPDTLLCMLAGTTKMSLKRFLIILILFRAPAIITYTVLTSTGASYIFNTFIK